MTLETFTQSFVVPYRGEKPYLDWGIQYCFEIEITKCCNLLQEVQIPSEAVLLIVRPKLLKV